MHIPAAFARPAAGCRRPAKDVAALENADAVTSPDGKVAQRPATTDEPAVVAAAGLVLHSERLLHNTGGWSGLARLRRDRVGRRHQPATKRRARPAIPLDAAGAC
jgi:hypothetical protein